jgi:hypothetical protein
MKRVLWHVLGLFLVAVAGVGIAYKIVHVPAQLELVVLLGVALVYPVVRYPVVGVYVIFIVSPFIPFIRRLFYLAHGRPTLDPLIVVSDLVLSFMLIGLFFALRDEAQRDRAMATYRRVILVYFCYLALRAVVLNHNGLSRAVADFKYYGPPVLIFLVGGLYARKDEHLKRLWVITAVIALVAALYGFRQLYFGYIRAEQIWISSVDFTSLFVGGIARPFSFFQAPVAFADYMLLGALAVLMVTGWSRRATILLLTIPLLFYANLVTSVRSSWIGIMGAMAIWAGLTRLRTPTGRIAAIILLPLCYMCIEFITETFGSGLSIDTLFRLASSVMPNQRYMDLLVTSRASALYNPLEEHSFLSRILLWKYILASSVDPIHAIAGRGIGVLKADSLYMTYLAELGYPGLVFIVGLLVVFTKAALGLMDNATDRFSILLGRCMVTLNIVLAVTSITGTHIHYFPGDIYFWFWNGVVVKRWVSLRHMPEGEHEES